MENISPIFYNCTQQIRLKLTPDYQETVIEIYLNNCMDISPFNEVDLNIDLSVLISTDCYMQSCQINSVICVAPDIEKYPNLLYIRKVQLINFEDTTITLDKTKPILSFHIYNETKAFELIFAPKMCFEGLYRNLLNTQKLNSVQYLSCVLSKQLLNLNEHLAQKSLNDKMIECNSALIDSRNEKY